MNRETIDFGIDLGTTNSSIAMWGSDGQVEVIKNLDQSQSTPSSVYIDAKHRIHVGERAKNRIETDSQNVHFEFKQQMGRKTEYTFPVNGRTMTPEELSSEVLKSLKADVQRRFNEELRASVITIPAAFDKAEIYATNRAANLSGFSASPLCLEPVAAALAYGHKSASEEGFWLVFDFGGGTFDSAIVQLKDEEFQIVNHEGDNHLGGKLIDWAILDQILIRAVQKELGVAEFSRQNDDPNVKTAIAKFKLATEKAKVRLSAEAQAEIVVDFGSLGGKDHEFEHELTRAEVNRMAEPYILRAINLCKEALSDKRLTTGDIERLILVGGPTQMPIFREMLADPNVGLGIPLEYSVDPMTVVAQGAAIFARTQKLDIGEAFLNRVSGEIGIQLDYEPAGADEEPDVAGRLMLEEGESPADFTIEFIKNNWRSGRVPVSDDGTFMIGLNADRGENTYTIEVQDNAGNVRKATPNRLNYLRKPMFREIPLTQTIAVARADNTTDIIFEKGIALPLRKGRDYTQTVAVNKTESTGEIRIPLVEGSNERADRNALLGVLTISPGEVKRDVPAGSTVEFTLSVDESNMLTVTAYIPILDQDFETVLDPQKPDVDQDRLRTDAETEIERMRKLEESVSEVEDERAKAAMAKINDERILDEVENALSMLDKGRDAEDLLLNRLRNLRLELDKVEAVLEWPSLMRQAERNKTDAENIINESNYAEDADKTTFAQLCKEHEQALSSQDSDLLRRVNSEFNDIYWTIARRNPGNWAALFENLRDARSQMSDQGLVNDLFAQGHRSIDNGDLDGLKSAVNQLLRQLPREEANRISNTHQGTVQ